MRRKRELMQFEIGMSTMRYLPASGTAGLARSFVSGKRRVPWPPPMMTQSTLLMLRDCRPVCDIKNFFEFGKTLTPMAARKQAGDLHLRKIYCRGAGGTRGQQQSP